MERYPGPDALLGSGSIDSGHQDTGFLLFLNLLVNLLDAEQVLHATDLASPIFFIVIFAGCACLSVGMILKNIRTVKPCDIRHGKEFGVL